MSLLYIPGVFFLSTEKEHSANKLLWKCAIKISEAKMIHLEINQLANHGSTIELN